MIQNAVDNQKKNLQLVQILNPPEQTKSMTDNEVQAQVNKTTVATQSQVYYARHLETPRFKPLEEYAQGAWVMSDNR